MAKTTQRVKNLNSGQRQGVLKSLLKSSHNGKLEYGPIKRIIVDFHVSSKTVNCIWNRAKTCHDFGSAVANVESKKKGNSGLRQKNQESIFNKAGEIPLSQRSTFHDLCTKIAS